MVKYAKSCGRLPLRYGIIIVAIIDIVLSAILLGFDASHIHYNAKNHERSVNATVRNRSAMEDDKSGINIAAVAGLVGQLLTIIIAFSLIAVAILHRAKFRKMMIVWLAWSGGGLGMIIVALFIRIANHQTDAIDISITLIFVVYELFCVWLVISYYKLLSTRAHDENDGYNMFANQNDFST